MSTPEDHTRSQPEREVTATVTGPDGHSAVGAIDTGFPTDWTKP